ncbi:MFS transporter [Vibrio tubiashii]|uniref:MFS transporter n=1 Tax=Vibrio tubiashii TaxID=29498 RepID=UPI00234F6C35|nr:MFS transporter [Vibrio tubiashii]WCP69223.1 MFS transporter [Vibrio tubiashii]
MSVLHGKKAQLWAISSAAALMGIGQNGLLVSLPFLVERSAFSLPTWSILIAIGSFLFLPSAPYWGRYSDKRGPRNVVVQALFGMAISFVLLFLFAILSEHQPHMVMLWLVGLILARIIYGCTVSGMVPACQHWAILLCGTKNRLQAITSISIGLSVGRLVGPLIAIVALKFSPYAPLTLMIVLPLIALLTVLFQPTPQHGLESEKPAEALPWLPNKSFMPYLLSGLLLCAAIALLQYSFTPLMQSVTSWSTAQISDGIGVLLTISAACTFAVQLIVVKNKKITPMKMYRFGSVGLLCGLVLFLLPNIWLFAFAMVIAASGAALLVPAYTYEATEKQSDAPGSVAGYIAMSHTIGYGLASLLAFTATINPLYPIYLCLTFSGLIVATAYLVTKRPSNEVANPS